MTGKTDGTGIIPMLENAPLSGQPRGLWFIYGVGLPDEVLRKIYYQNAVELFPSVRAKWNRKQDEQKTSLD